MGGVQDDTVLLVPTPIILSDKMHVVVFGLALTSSVSRPPSEASDVLHGDGTA